MKRVLSMLLTAAMILSMLVAAIPASAATPSGAAEKKATVSANHVPADFDGDGVTDADAIEIDTMAELQNMQGKKGYLTRDFVVTMADAKPSTDAHSAFTIAFGWPGVDTYLDGCGYTVEFDKTVEKGGAATPVALFNGSGATIHVKNLNLTGVINAESDGHVAPLCKHGGAGVIENVVVDVDVTVKSLHSNGAISGVWGKTEGSTPVLSMKDVHFTGSIDVKCAVPTGSYGGLGAMIGHANSAFSLTDCSNSGNITVTENGETEGNIGGLVGYTRGAATITNCSNSGNVTVKGKIACIGGFIGKAESKVVISNSSNSGNVTHTTSIEAYGHNGIGGFVGAVMGGNDVAKASSITGCTNSGAVTVSHVDSAKSVGNIYVGGIVGRAYQTAGFNFENCSNSGVIKNIGTSGAGWGSVGGILGTFITITNTTSNPITLQLKNCENSAEITGLAGVGGIVGSAKQFNHDSTGVGQILLNIIACKNTAKINGTSGDAPGTAGIAGDISAESSDSTMKLTVYDCVNIGDVVGKGWHAGGIIGRYSWANATDVATVERCVNTGDVKLDRAATKEDPWLDAAGIVCQATGGSEIAINDCINTGAISTAEATGKSTYPITNCVNTVISGNSVESNVASYVTASGNVYLAGSVLRSDATYHKFSSEATAADIIAKIDGFTTYSNDFKAAAKTGVSAVYSELYYAVEDALAYQASLDENAYTIESWDAFDAAIKAAQNLLYAANIPADAAMTEAKDNVNSKKDALIAPNYSALTSAIAAANGTDFSKYSAENEAAIKAAIATAEGYLTSRNQSEINAAAETLNTAVSAIAKLDYSALTGAIAAANATDFSKYSVENENAIKTAIATAEGYLTNRVQSEINAAVEALNAAVSETAKLDYSALTDAITAARAVNQNEYTVESLAALEDAIAVAEGYLTNRVQSEINAAAAELQGVIGSLVKPDYSALNALLAEADNYDANEYDATTWATFEAAVAAAEALTASNSQTDIDAGVKALNDAISALEGIDLTLLENAIAAAEALNFNEYSEADEAAIKAAIDTAKGYLTSRNQNDIDNAATALNEAVNGKTKLNYSVLTSAIAAANATDFSKYSVENENAIKAAIRTAEGYLTNRVQSEINAAAEALNAAVSGAAKLDYSALTGAITTARAKVEADHTTESWEGFEDAIVAAEAKLSSRVQSEINSAAAALNTAIGALRTPDYSALNAAILAAGAKNEDDYTASTWADLQTALAAARSKLTSRTQADINAALNVLNAAITALEEIPDTPTQTPTEPEGNEPGNNDPADTPTDDPADTPTDDPADTPEEAPKDEPADDTALNFTELDGAIAEAVKLKESGYTAESWAALKTALVNAKKLLTSAKTQDEIDAAVVAIEDAIEALEKAKAVENTQGKDTAADADDDDETDERGGCGSAIAASTVVLATVLTLGLGFKKKD